MPRLLELPVFVYVVTRGGSGGGVNSGLVEGGGNKKGFRLFSDSSSPISIIGSSGGGASAIGSCIEVVIVDGLSLCVEKYPQGRSVAEEIGLGRRDFDLEKYRPANQIAQMNSKNQSYRSNRS